MGIDEEIELDDDGNESTFVDFGYLFQLPGLDDNDILDSIVHVDMPQGGDKCSEDPIWISLRRLVSYPQVKCIRAGKR